MRRHIGQNFIGFIFVLILFADRTDPMRPTVAIEIGHGDPKQSSGRRRGNSSLSSGPFFLCFDNSDPFPYG